LAQKHVPEHVSAAEALLALREKDRRMTLEEYVEKVGLGEKFQEFARKKNSKSR
jgi:hypothetical protein